MRHGTLSFLWAFVLLAVCGIALADLDTTAHDAMRNSKHGISRRHHAARARRETAPRIEKRFSDARLSFYDAGQNACGSVDTDASYIVALNSDQFNNGEYCYKQITITANGKSMQATITDECPGCPYAGLDLSRGLFDYFAPESVGILYGSWEFGDGAAPSTSSAWMPTTTYTPTSTYQAPTSTWTPPAPTTTWSSSSAYTPSSTYSSYSSYSSFSSSTSTSTSTSTSAASSTRAQTSATTKSVVSVPKPTAARRVSFDTGNLNQFNMAIVGMSGLVEAANWA
ncbi:hypothetical protein WOLCODRAFT_23466 [Wolfiporia cocos MD-104 SS10]|uniref:RlpA-like protein double-psi beta-barrel domain-containing protein n=1 Tax=Wolfiporia cocos (strain MD-104) TaxID=742152 RepID=A0A2H3JIL4_WOLCO|nr:hypothetical protein WOLCODRAFT_23466 [Wolfiporia cocos MD-104 SS10]